MNGVGSEAEIWKISDEQSQGESCINQGTDSCKFDGSSWTVQRVGWYLKENL